MIISGTGHRPDKLPNKETGYKIPNPTYNYVCQQIEKHLLELKPDKVFSGMALGYDQWLANVAIKLGIPVVAAVPFIGQEKMWPDKSKCQYKKLLDKCKEVVIVSEGSYSAQKMQIRNVYLVNHCDILLSCHDGSPGGTNNCIKYAESVNKQIININPLLANK